MEFEETADYEFEREINKRFVYFLLKGNEVVYVGQTTKGLSRPLAHNDKDYDTIQVKYVEDLDYWECFYIAKYLPKYNMVFSSDVLYVSYKRARDVIKYKTNSYSYSVTNLKKDMLKINSVPVVLPSGIRYISRKDIEKILVNIYQTDVSNLDEEI